MSGPQENETEEDYRLRRIGEQELYKSKQRRDDLFINIFGSILLFGPALFFLVVGIMGQQWGLIALMCAYFAVVGWAFYNK